MLQEKEIEIKLSNGEKKTFVISKFPATEGRRIISQYPVISLLSNTKIGSYEKQEELMLDLMSYVAVKTEMGNIQLKTKELINNHCPDWECLMSLEKEMLVYNCSFFQNGKGYDYLQSLLALVVQSITETLMSLSDK